MLSPRAESDLRRIWHYGNEIWGMEAADAYYHALFDCFEKLAENPYHYPETPHIRKNYRKLTYKSDTIYYRIGSDTVEIMAILGKQDIDKLQ